MANRRNGDRVPVSRVDGDRPRPQEKVSISLRFYAPGVKCFSQWERTNPESFSDLVSKLRKLDVLDL